MSDDKQFLLQLETQLYKALKSCINYKSGLFKACEYSLFGSAKRIRPLLLKRLCDSNKLSWKTVIPASVHIEFIHTFSLIHDDLPCMDNSDYRRGKLSCHKQFNEPTAVLAGDLLLSTAYIPLSSYKQNLSHILTESSRYLGDLMNGQFIDIHKPPSSTKNAILLYKMKTASLFTLCSVIFSLVTNNKQTEQYRTFGETLGILFQATDDYLDSPNVSKSISQLVTLYHSKTLKSVNKLNLTDKSPIEDYIDMVYKRTVTASI